MAIHSLRDVLMLAAAGGFGGYTYWTFATTVRALRARVGAGKRRR
jgi:hypothetical protein